MGTPDTNRNRVVVIGVDGATFSVMDPLLNADRLPNIAGMIARGVRGPLLSTVPPLSPIAWTSFMTGVNPGKHGIFDFVARHPDSYRMVRCSSRDRQAKALWTILSESGRRVCVLGVTLTYPPDPVNGCMVSGLGAPFNLKGATYTHPPELASEINSKVGEYSIIFPIPLDRFNRSERVRDDYLRLVHEAFDYRWRLFEYLWKKESYDFALPFFLDTDGISHHFWKYVDPKHKLFEPNRHQDAVNATYAKIDEMVGKILALAGRDTNVVIVSDHGFGPLNRVLHLNNWLERKGCLKGRKITLVAKVLNRLLRRDRGYIEWDKTIAYFMGTFGNVRINLKGREPGGIIEPERYEDLRSDLAGALRELVDPETGRRILKGVRFREELYQGPALDRAPDIILEFEDGYDVFGEEIDQNRRHVKEAVVTDCRRWSGKHEPEGVFIACGPQFRKGLRIGGARIIDVAPTVLHLLGVPVPDNMDGMVLEGGLTEDFLRANPVKYQQAAQLEAKTGAPGGQEGAESEDLMNRLRDLGYLE